MYTWTSDSITCWLIFHHSMFLWMMYRSTDKLAILLENTCNRTDRSIFSSPKKKNPVQFSIMVAEWLMVAAICIPTNKTVLLLSTFSLLWDNSYSNRDEAICHCGFYRPWWQDLRSSCWSESCQLMFAVVCYIKDMKCEDKENLRSLFLFCSWEE